VSDYSSEVLDDGTSLVVFGGQTTEGEMVALEKVLVFNTETREWYAKVSGTNSFFPILRQRLVALEYRGKANE